MRYKRAPSKQEVDTVLRLSPTMCQKSFVVLSAWAGLSLPDIKGLRISQQKLELNEPHPSELTVNDKRGVSPHHFTYLSTEGSEYLNRYLEERMAQRDHQDNLFDHKDLARAIRRIRGVGFTIRQLRAYFIKSLLEARVSDEDIKAMLGYPTKRKSFWGKEQYAAIENKYFTTKPSQENEKLPDLGWMMRFAEEERERRTGA